jgi:hypothetical protein
MGMNMFLRLNNYYNNNQQEMRHIFDTIKFLGSCSLIFIVIYHYDK